MNNSKLVIKLSKLTKRLDHAVDDPDLTENK
ncbi:hypothetical protein H323_14830 [Vibrio parahaemolyticus VP766]|nr:hypothetical protein H323_14830 [Vibrio parahaemolyticus VP766]